MTYGTQAVAVPINKSRPVFDATIRLPLQCDLHPVLPDNLWYDMSIRVEHRRGFGSVYTWYLCNAKHTDLNTERTMLEKYYILQQ